MTTPYKPVDLIDPDGRPYTAETAVEFHDLHYGHGYRIVKPAEDAPAATNTTPTGDAGSGAKSRKADTTTS